ncbi:MAG: hypothetical protein ABIA37_00920 [Candidatus Woesearchaeota archaeon]
MVETILSEIYNLELLKRTKVYSPQTLVSDINQLDVEYQPFIAYCDSLANNSKRIIFQSSKELADFLKSTKRSRISIKYSEETFNLKQLLKKLDKNSLLVAYQQKKDKSDLLVVEEAETDLVGLLQKQVQNPRFKWLQLELRAKKQKKGSFNDFEYLLVASTNGRRGYTVRDIKASKFIRNYIERDPFDSSSNFFVIENHDLI